MKMRTFGNMRGLYSGKSPDGVKFMLGTVCRAAGLSLLKETTCGEDTVPVLCAGHQEESSLSSAVWVYPAAPGFSITYQEDSDGCFSIACDSKGSFLWDKAASKDAERVYTAFLLLCEHLFPGNLLCYHEDASRRAEVEQMIIPALRWLKHLFPEESFDDVLKFRTSPALPGWIKEHLEPDDSPEDAQEVYLRTSLFHDTTTEIRYLIDLFRSSMEQADTQEMMDSQATVIQLDKLHPFGLGSSEGDALTTLALCKSLRELFQLDGPDGEEEVCRAIRSLNLIRQGTGVAAEQEWKKYDFPQQVALRFHCMEWEGLLKILSYLSQLPEQRVMELADRILPQWREDSRACLKGVLRKAKLEELRLQYREDEGDTPYLSEKSGSGDTDFCTRWTLDCVLEKGIPSYAMYRSFRENGPVLSGEESGQLCILAKKLEKEYVYMTEELFSVLLNGILEKDRRVYAAVKTLGARCSQAGRRGVSEFLSFLENEALRRKCLGF